MGSLFVGSATKGFTDLTLADKSRLTAVSKTEVSPALAKLLEALKVHGNVDEPTEIVIGVMGSKKHQVFTVTVEDLHEIREILQWTLGQE